jgi:hypothetical protein
VGDVENEVREIAPEMGIGFNVAMSFEVILLSVRKFFIEQNNDTYAKICDDIEGLLQTKTRIVNGELSLSREEFDVLFKKAEQAFNYLRIKRQINQQSRK